MRGKKAMRRLALSRVPEASFRGPVKTELLMIDLSRDTVGEPASGLEEKNRY